MVPCEIGPGLIRLDLTMDVIDAPVCSITNEIRAMMNLPYSKVYSPYSYSDISMIAVTAPKGTADRRSNPGGRYRLF